MAKMVREYNASGQSQKVFSVSQVVIEGKLHYWVSKLSRPDKVLPTIKESPFVPIEIAPSLSGKTDQAILIRLTSGVEIEIPV